MAQGEQEEASPMTMSIEELREIAARLRTEGLNSQQIADELSLSHAPVAWLLAGSQSREAPTDVRIGWRTIGVKPERIEAIGDIMADVTAEETGHDPIDTVVGISINGIVFAQETAKNLGAEVAILRNIEGGPGQGALSDKYGRVSGKRVAIIDDVLSSGVTMSRTIQAVRDAGGTPVLAVVLVNKTMRNEIENVPLRGIIRAVPV